VSLPLIAFVVFFVRRFVVTPLTEMNASLAEIAKGEGDLTRRLGGRARRDRPDRGHLQRDARHDRPAGPPGR
jgi:methyl-accepting chemotaxis protein